MSRVRNVLLFLLMVASWTVGFAVVPEDLPHVAPPPALQQALDAFFNKRKGDFIIKETAGFVEKWEKQRAVGNDESNTKFMNDIHPVMTEKMGRLRETLEQNHCKVLKLDEKTLVFEAPEFPGFLCKMPGSIFSVLHSSQQHNLRRVDCARAIQKAIQVHGHSKFLSVPAKYLYHLPWAGTELNDSNYVVVAERIAGREGAVLGPDSLEQGLALLEVATQCGLEDVYSANFLKDSSGRMVFIDTEDFCDWSLASMSHFYVEHASMIDRICPEFGNRLKATSPAEFAAMRPLLQCLHGAVMVHSGLGRLGGAASHDFLVALEAYASTYFEKRDSEAQVVQDLARMVVLNRNREGGVLQ